MSKHACAAVILAAGASTRLGQPKQLVEIDGETLLRRTVRMTREAGCDPVAVVLGFEAERMMSTLEGSGAVIVSNADWASGMGSSVRCGVQAVLAHEPPPRSLLLLVCDQVALNSELLRGMLRRHGEGAKPITAARYAGRNGVPAIFASSCFEELLAVSGDRGARMILNEDPDRVASVEFAEGELDLDLPEDLSRVRRSSTPSST